MTIIMSDEEFEMRVREYAAELASRVELNPIHIAGTVQAAAMLLVAGILYSGEVADADTLITTVVEEFEENIRSMIRIATAPRATHA